MQSILALAGVVGLAAAAYAPQYDNSFRTSTEDALLPGSYETPAPVFSALNTIPEYHTAIESARVPIPYYSSSLESARVPVYRTSEALRWSTTKYIRTSAYTTYCPEATTLSFNTKTYTITSATTLTVTDCYNGCQVVKPLPTTTILQTAPIIKTTQFETYCPEPTTITYSARTFTVTEATTLTIPQNITTTSVFRTVIPIQPTYAPVYNSTVKLSTTFQAPVAPTYESPVSPALTYESPVAPLPTTTTLNAIIPPYPSSPAKPAIWQPTGTGTGRIYPTAPIYTGAAVANRVGAGALMAAAGFAALL